MPKPITFCLAALILVVSASPGLTYREGGKSSSQISPGTRFGRQPLDNKRFPYLYPVHPELWRQEQREREENQVSLDASPKNEPPDHEKPAPPKGRRSPKIIEVK